MIAIDPHEASWTAAAVNAALQPLDTLRVPVNRDGYRRLRRFARRWPGASWAIEGASGLGAALLTRLTADGVEAVNVPAKLAARVRLLSSGHGRKNDNADAISVGIAAMTSTELQTVRVDQAIAALRTVVEHRDDLVKTRTQTVNRLHVLLTQLIPAGAPTRLTADTAAELLSRVRPHAALQRTLRRLAVDLVGEIRRLDRRITSVGSDIADAVTEAGCTLDKLYGISSLLAGKILARVGDVARLRSAAAFAAFNGTAPIEVSSGDIVRHRLSRAGDRQLNYCLHIMAITQIRGGTAGRAYYHRKTRSWAEPQGSSQMPQAATVRRCLPPARLRRNTAGDEPGERGAGDRTLPFLALAGVGR